MTRGRFIVLEGGDATGKTTQSMRLAERLGARLTREPGGTPFGERMREAILDPATGDLDPRTEALVMLAARSEHVAQVIGPALDRGEDVVCDRFVGSTMAYQGYGRGLGPDLLRLLSVWATRFLEPDLTIYLSLPPKILASRIGHDLDRIELAGDDFHERVTDGFDQMAAELGWTIIDASGSVSEVHERVWAAVVEHGVEQAAGVLHHADE